KANLEWQGFRLRSRAVLAQRSRVVRLRPDADNARALRVDLAARNDDRPEPRGLAPLQKVGFSYTFSRGRARGRRSRAPQRSSFRGCPILSRDADTLHLLKNIPRRAAPGSAPPAACR